MIVSLVAKKNNISIQMEFKSFLLILYRFNARDIFLVDDKLKR